MRVTFTEPAIDDLREIGDHLALDSQLRAIKVLSDLRQTCADLGQLPLRFPAYETLGAGVRRRVHGRYLIFYRVGSTVEVLRILHSSRGYDRLFPSGG